MHMTRDSAEMAPSSGMLLGRFFLLSLCAHAIVATAWHTPSVPPMGEMHSSLAIVLSPLRTPASTQTAMADTGAYRPKHKAAPTSAPPAPTAAPRAITQHSAAASVAPAAIPATVVASMEEDIPAVDSTTATTSLAAHIKLELARHFHYPAQAVRRGWQGIVLLGFRIGIDGDIEDIHIAQSSGHALLDRAALGALGKVHKVALDSGTLRAALDLQLPVIYRLEES